jgi:phage replication-related protein YjqB (UPF0714/DUF867 family)
MAKDFRQGVDYEILMKDLGAPTTVMAVHGGKLEIGTGELAADFAQDDVNLYEFKAMMEERNVRMHITSIHYDEPSLLSLVARSERCLSLHGLARRERTVCVGGLNAETAEKVANELKKHPEWELNVLYPCSIFPAIQPENIVNRCQRNGVQLEMGRELREQLLSDAPFRKKVSQALRKVFFDAP